MHRGAVFNSAATCKAEVGSVRVGHLHVHIDPKLKVKRVLFILGFAASKQRRIRWQSGLVGFSDSAGLVPAFAHMLWRRAEAALAPGVLTGYLAKDATSSVLRDRLRETDQLYRGRGLGHSLEIRYDDLTTDIPENQIWKAALGRMLGVADVDTESQQAIRHQLALLADVSTLPAHLPPPRWTPNRLNLRYAEALTLAELVLKRRSVEHGGGVTLAD
jgi:5-methylcytosine-specific restriction enzyme subunit McrC